MRKQELGDFVANKWCFIYCSYAYTIRYRSKRTRNVGAQPPSSLTDTFQLYVAVVILDDPKKAGFIENREGIINYRYYQ